MAEALALASSILAVIELTAKISTLCIKYTRSVKNASKDAERLREATESLKTTLDGVSGLLNGPHGPGLEATRKLLKALENSRSFLESLEHKLQPSSRRQSLNRLGIQSLKWPFNSKEFEKQFQDVSRCTQAITASLQIDQLNVSLETSHDVRRIDNGLRHMDRKADLRDLPAVHDAAFNSYSEARNPFCLENTQIEFLHQILEWAHDSQGKPIFWLKGMAGTGKSTISRTVARHLAKDGLLGASFFFKRGEADRSNVSKLFASIAYQLAMNDSVTRDFIADVIGSDPSIPNKTLEVQFQKLILDPLSKAYQSTWRKSTLTIIVDALDECEKEEDVRCIINLLSQSTTLQCPQLRIFVTSRPELQVRLGFSDISGKHRELDITATSTSSIEHDISLYFRYELDKLRRDYNSRVPGHRRLPEDWPGHHAQELIQMAVPLFIFAATVCRFLAEVRWEPEDQLRKILGYRARSQLSKLDATYKPVLDRLIEGLSAEERDEILEDFRRIVGSIIVLENSLSITALANLLNVSKQSIDLRLDLLHSVLSIPESLNEPVQLLHKSFRDFLLDETLQSSKMFWIEAKQAHRRISACCLRLMKEQLREDILSVRDPGIARSTVSQQTIAACVPSELQYACQYWTYHLEQGGLESSDDATVYQFLSHQFLYWLEALSWIGRAYESMAAVRTLNALFASRQVPHVLAFLDEAIRVLLTFLTVIDSSPLQLYSSVLIFCPSNTIFRTTFRPQSWITASPSLYTSWGQCQVLLEGHDKWVPGVAFSHNSKLAATSSDDRTFRIWDVETGQCIHVVDHDILRPHRVAFSNDSTLLATSDEDRVIRLWNVATVECIFKIPVYQNSHTVALSFVEDSDILCATLENGVVQMWNVQTGECVEIIKQNKDECILHFWYSSKIAAILTNDNVISIRRTDTDRDVFKLDGHTNDITSFDFSRDLTVAVTGSKDQTARIWCLKTGTCKQILAGHTGELTIVALSHDSKLVASGSDTIRLWQVDNGKCLQFLRSHSEDILALAFSHDSTLLISGSMDCTARIWPIDLSALKDNVESYNVLPTAVAISEDETCVAVLAEKSVSLYCVTSGVCFQVLSGSERELWRMLFVDNSKFLITVSHDYEVRVWRVEDGSCIQKGYLEEPSTGGEISIAPLTGHIYIGDAKVDGLEYPIAKDFPTPGQISSSIAPALKPRIGLHRYLRTGMFGWCPGHGFDWITWDDKKVIWMPLDFQPPKSPIEVVGSTMVIVSEVGFISIISLSPQVLDGLLERPSDKSHSVY